MFYLQVPWSEREVKQVQKRCTSGKDHEHICFAFIFVCVVGKNLKSPKLSPMADDAITRGGIGGLVSLVHICVCISCNEAEMSDVYFCSEMIFEVCSYYLEILNKSPKSFSPSAGDSEQQVLLVTVPKFIETQACVMVNLRTLDCQPLVFSSNLTPSEK